MLERLLGPPVRVLAWLALIVMYPYVRIPIWYRKHFQNN